MADFPVTQGNFQNPPKTFTFVIPNNGAQRIDYAMNFFRVLAFTGTVAGTTIQFGQVAIPSDIFAAGVGYQLPEVIQNVIIVNSSGAPITITVVCAVGVVYDDRLNTVGTVTITGAVTVTSGNIANTPVIPATLADIANVAVLTTATTKVLSSNVNRKEAFISNLLVNNTLIKIGSSTIGAARGIEVPIGGTAVISNTADIYVYNPSGGTINIGVMESNA